MCVLGVHAAHSADPAADTTADADAPTDDDDDDDAVHSVATGA